MFRYGMSILVAVISFHSTMVHANDRVRKFLGELELSGHVGSEHFKWTDLNASGGTVAKEQGRRGTVDISFGNYARRSSGILLGFDIEMSRGTVDYDGDAWTGVQVPPPQAAVAISKTTSTRVSGGFNAGYRYVTGPVGLSAMAGYRTEQWGREIENGLSTIGNPTYGHNESYSINLIRMLAGIDFRAGPFDFGIRGGFMFPSGTRTITLDVPTSDDTFDVDLNFKRASFAEVRSGLNIGQSNHHRVLLRLVWSEYETKADSSIFVSDRGTAYLQPGFRMRTVGTQLGYSYSF